MLKNPIYTGRVTNKKSEVADFITGTRKDLPEEEWITVERLEKRIISDELFNRAQDILAQRSNEFKLNNKREKTKEVNATKESLRLTKGFFTLFIFWGFHILSPLL